MSKFIQIQFTAPSLEEAREIAQALILKGLVACANIFPIVESWFIWEEKLEQANEVKVLLKTLDEHFPAIEALILEYHSHVIPEILALPILRGHKPYLDWLTTSVTESPE